MQIDVLEFFRQKNSGPLSIPSTAVQILMQCDCMSLCHKNENYAVFYGKVLN
jgi:hypothetical protein